jgi:hypothetical protein
MENQGQLRVEISVSYDFGGITNCTEHFVYITKKQLNILRKCGFEKAKEVVRECLPTKETPYNIAHIIESFEERIKLISNLEVKYSKRESCGKGIRKYSNETIEFQIH